MVIDEEQHDDQLMVIGFLLNTNCVVFSFPKLKLSSIKVRLLFPVEPFKIKPVSWRKLFFAACVIVV